MSDTPDVSVIIATLNAEATVERAVNSVISEARAANKGVEIIVAEGGSVDGTTKRLARYPNLRIFEQAKSGLAAARNEAISMARAPLVAFCDADDLWVDGSLSRRLQAMAEKPEAWGVSGRVRFEGVLSDSTGQPARRSPGEEHTGYTPGAIIVRRSVFDTIAFDEALAIAADADWFIRAIWTLGEMFHIDDVVLTKGLRTGSLSTDVGTYRQEMLVTARRHLRRVRGYPE